MKGLKDNYYVSSFFWSTVSKILNAIFNFFAVPLLLGLYGKADYGILAIATSCNGYMLLLDLGMNVGSVKFLSQWRVEGKNSLIQKVVNTNVTFYLIVASINIIGLLALAVWGEPLFSITHEQFLTLRMCLIIIAIFCVFSWEATPFNQLLTAYKKISFVMQMQSWLPLFKLILVLCTIYFRLPLLVYFFLLTLLLSLLVVPYAYECKRSGILESLKLGFYWKEFSIVLAFSVSIFVLSLFRTTASQSRSILLSMFALDGAGSVAEFNIISVFPTFIIMLSGTFSSIFLPQASELVSRGNQNAIESFAYRWTRLSTIVVILLCFPFIVGSKEAIAAYVGEDYLDLSKWLILWVVTVLVQMHTTASESLVLAYGRTKLLVYASASACIISVILNIFLCKYLQVGSAIVSYLVYVLIVISVNYMTLYKSLLKLSRLKIFVSFFKPLLPAVISLLICYVIPFDTIYFFDGNRWYYLTMFVIKTLTWAIPYILLIHFLKIFDYRELTQLKK